MIDPTALKILEWQEGVRYFVYDDFNGLPLKKGMRCVGNPTIGIGRSLNIEGITYAEAVQLAGDDWSALQSRFAALPWFVAQNAARQFVVLDMAFQMGFAGVMQFEGMIHALAIGDYDAAADDMLDSVWAEETPARAEMLAGIMRSGDLSK